MAGIKLKTVSVRANQLKTTGECLKAIENIEMNPSNVVGGSRSFFSGLKTTLTEKAQRKVDAINRQMEKIGNNDDDDDE
jgi:hypothetical protein